MTTARYVILGLAHPRSDWFRSAAHWSNGGALPAEFIKCISADEVRQRFDDGRNFSALIVDAGLSGVDRDLFTVAALSHCVVFVVDDPNIDRDWIALGASAVLPNDLDRATLLDSLASHATMISRATVVTRTDASDIGQLLPRGTVVAVVGPGGTGVSTVATAAAQGLAAAGRSTVLADFRLNAEQAMLHDATDSGGGLQSLVEAVRTGDMPIEKVREFTLAVPQRGYDLLPGLRRSRFWSALRPVAFTAAFTALTRGYGAIVCDVDADLETEENGGSLDVEERTVMSRVALTEADAVMVVAHPSMKGLHSLNRLLIDLGDLGIDAARTMCVFNHAPKSAKSRAGYVAALAELIDWRGGQHPSLSPLHLPSREIDEALRAGHPLPHAMSSTVTAGIMAITQTAPVGPTPTRTFSRIRPGSLRRHTESKAS